MKEYNLFGFKVEIDEVATKKWYDRADRTDKDSDVPLLNKSYVAPFFEKL